MCLDHPQYRTTTAEEGGNEQILFCVLKCCNVLFIYLSILNTEVQAQGGTKRLIASGSSPTDGRLGNMQVN